MLYCFLHRFLWLLPAFPSIVTTFLPLSTAFSTVSCGCSNIFVGFQCVWSSIFLVHASYHFHLFSVRKRSFLPGFVPLGNLLTVGYRCPLGPPFWWPKRPWGCIGKYKETAGRHDNDQRESWRKPELRLGTNRDDAVTMLEKYSASAGKCDNNQRKWCKDHRKMKETGKTLGRIQIDNAPHTPYSHFVRKQQLAS